MPKLSGVFDAFKDLDKINPVDITSWLKIKGDIHTVLNFIGNRILYPQTIPTNSSELDIDHAILREAIKLQPELFFKDNKIIIPTQFKDRFPPLNKLVTVIIEALNPKGVTYVYLKEGTKPRIIGTIIAPPDLEKLKLTPKGLQVIVNGVETFLPPNSLSVSQTPDPKIRVKLDDTLDLDVAGGELGLIIDLRIKDKK